MRALIIRTGSVPGQKHSLFPGSPRVSASQNNLSSAFGRQSPEGFFSGDGDTTGVVGDRRNPIRVREEIPAVSAAVTVLVTVRSPAATRIGARWARIIRRMLKSNPTDSLLLRNYGRFLHEIEGDVVKAEEYYGRAILASPGDGEVLALYGNLIWETQRDRDRAKSYFDRAVHSSPDDCMVLGSYAHFHVGGGG
ncbi:tetratricopeptide repeat (TPR)-like superfamily protein [Actinidia rufa]|uniref:Tetratricopeptide repeat (TPR)-like superfamily protein n=1 Tax=Actinidia rufa TaxID=165716 RepID=A0A7J0FPY3_9ERIC|nr:tetratricopeptide repeat (TPR)-like superfamily protein [Actinidia rufa]